MKNVFLFLGIVALVACKKETVDKVEYFTRLKSIEEVGGITHQFIYNEQNQLSQVIGTEDVLTFKYDANNHISNTTWSFTKYMDRYDHSYSYDELGRLIYKESVYVDQNGLEMEPYIRLLSYEEEGFIRAKNPGDQYSTWYKMSNGNVEYINCFNCGSFPEFSYTDIPSPLPEELANTWQFYGPRLSFMSHLEIYSRSIPKDFFSFIGMSIPVAVENEILLNDEGLPKEIKVVLKEDFNSYKKGHVLNVSKLEYETIKEPS